MNPFDAFVDALANGIEFLTHFDRQVIRDAGANPTLVTEWDQAHTVYFGPTKWTKQQSRAVGLARENKVSLDKLVLIEKRIKHIDDTAQRWQLRHRLLATGGSYENLKRRAKEIVPEKETAKPKKSMRFSRSRNGLRSLTATLDESLVAAIEHSVANNIDSSKPAQPQMADAFAQLLFDGSENTDSHINPGRFNKAVPRPIIVVPLASHVKILAGAGDDTVLGLSDGTTLTGAEYLGRFHGTDVSPNNEVALFHPQRGPVNLYRTSRRPNEKQRDLLRMTSTVCPVPDCRHAADLSEVHHITAWKNGGETNLANLAIACRYHNRTNNDDPDLPTRRSGFKKVRHRGRIENRSGRRVWVSPRGQPVTNSYHRYGAMDVLFGKNLRV